MARAAWSAFECSSLASKSNDAKEQERLFLFGYDQGKQFIAAVQAGKVKQEHLSAEAPLIMLLLLQGPTVIRHRVRAASAALPLCARDAHVASACRR
jgi:hypothetical protein